MAPPAPPSRMTSIAKWVQPRGTRDQSPPAGDADSWSRHGVGMQFAVEERGSLLISQMESGGSAARSGVCMSGDELLKVDGAVVERAPLDAVQGRVGGRAGTTVSLTLRRARQNLPPMVYEVELVRGDAEFMEVQARNKALSREHSTMAVQIEELQTQLQAKEAKLGDMMRDLNEFDVIASRAQEARRLAEQQRDQANAEVLRFKNQQKNIDQHVDRLVGELRDKERKLQQFAGTDRRRSTSPIADTACAADSGRTAVMGDASVPVDDSYAACTPLKEPTREQLQADLARALAAKNDLKHQLERQHALMQETDTDKMASNALAVKGEADAQLEQARQQCEKQQQMLQDYSDRNAALTAQLLRMQEDSAAALKRAEEELSSAEEQLKVAEEKLHTCSVRNNITMEGLNAEMTRCQQLSTAHQQLQGAHQELQQKFAAVQQELSEAKKLRLDEDIQRAAAHSQMDATALEQILIAEEKEMQMTTLRQQVEESRMHCEDLKAKNSYLQETIQKMETEFKVRESKATEYETSAAQKMDSMHAELNEANFQLLLLQGNMSSCKQAMAR
jgi:chromosome segregation ATPase